MLSSVATRHFSPGYQCLALISAIMLCLALPASAQNLSEGNGKQWYKGNTHTHTLWSDGNGAPEVVVKWYADKGYDFLALSDHNVFQDREVWFPISADSRLTPQRVEEIRATFGKDWPEVETRRSRERMRLRTLSELKEHFEKPGEFLLLPAEELTSPQVHVNSLNNQGVIAHAKPEEGDTKIDLLRRNFEAIEAHGREHGVPVLAHINHPNWSEGITLEEIAAVGGERFFEVFNGHSYVKNWGDGRYKPSTDRIWDTIVSLRMKDGVKHPMYGVATDDSHEYFKFGLGHENSGRGWIFVLAEELTPGELILAMKRGDFYASSGVTLTSIVANDAAYTVTVDPKPGETYTTQFIGTPKDFDSTSEPVLDPRGNPIPYASRIYSDDIGQVLHTTTDNPAVYPFTGKELYVRAKVVSSALQDNPFAKGDHETAWTQPVAPR